jgi:regulatory protein
VGQRLTQEEIAALEARDEVQRAYDRALRYLTYRPRSEAEVIRYLTRKGVSSDVQQEILERLQRLELIDDESFAQFWVDSREHSRPSGEFALRSELRQKGVSDAIVQRALEPLNQEKSAYRAATKRARRYHGTSAKEAKTKLGAFLLRRGFPYSVVKDVVAKVIAELAAEGKVNDESEESK